MRYQIIKSAKFLQHLIYTRFRGISSQIIDTLLLLSVCHLFRLYNPNQVADALTLPKVGLYRDIHAVSQHHWKCLNVRLGCAMALELIKDTVSKSDSTQSRRRPTNSVDDSLDIMAHFHEINPKEP